MHRVVYLDTLFIFNLCLDFALITGARLITRAEHRFWRELTGAAVGGILAVVEVLWGGGVLLRAAGAPLMSLIAFGWGGRARFLKLTLALLAITAGVGGGIFALYYLFGDGADFAMYGGTAYVNIRPLAFAAALPIASGIALAAYRMFSTGDGITRQVAEVELLIEGRRFTGRGLIDTGAALCEPISGRQAIIVQRSLVAPLYQIPPQSGNAGVRMVPFSTVAGDGFLPAVRCDAAVTLKGKRIVQRGLYAALSEQPLSPDGSYQIILGHAIMAGVEEGELFYETRRKV